MHTVTPNKVDVTTRWRLAGWVPPSEQKAKQVEWKFHRENLEVKWVDYVVKNVQVGRVV